MKNQDKEEQDGEAMMMEEIDEDWVLCIIKNEAGSCNV